MLATKELLSRYQAWNRQWGPSLFGGAGVGPLYENRLTPDLARSLGPFAFQYNSYSREVEYPWAYEVANTRTGETVLEIGGGLAGLQFALSMTGARVINVDPFVEFGSPVPYPTDIQSVHARLNRFFGTDVELRDATLPLAHLPSSSVDKAICVSTLEHLEPEELRETLSATYEALVVGGIFVVTVDLFLDLIPFSDAERNQWGANRSVMEIMLESNMCLLQGDRRELFGFPEFDAEHVKAPRASERACATITVESVVS